jgi:hypothetical protein
MLQRNILTAHIMAFWLNRLSKRRIAMSWAATLNIINDTDYNLTVNHNTVGDLTTIAPGANWSWTTSDPNNTNALRFWQQPNQWYMQGSVSFGPMAGVYIDRGWMAPDDQTIRLDADVNGTPFTQTENGGATVVPWNGFEQGGTIDIKLSKM